MGGAVSNSPLDLRKIFMGKKKKSQQGNDSEDGVIVDEVVEEIYEDEDQDSIEQPPALAKYTVKYAVIASIVGVCAGIAGAIWVMSGGLLPLVGQEIIPWGTLMGGERKQSEVVVTVEERIAEVVDRISPSVVSFVSVKQEDSEEGTRAVIEQKLGYGVVVTNDGWIATSPSVIADIPLEQVRVVTSGGASYSAIVQYQDWLEPFAYVRIDATGLLPASFGRTSDLLPGDTVFVASPAFSPYARSVAAAAVERLKEYPKKESSSEEFAFRIRVPSLASLDWRGAPVFSLSGAMVGMVVEEEDSVRIIPVDMISAANRTFFSEGRVVRTWLGVYTIDVAHTPVESMTTLPVPVKGALVWRQEKEAVEVKSPAASAGIKAQDIIVAVEDEEVNGKYSLAELIQSYPPGEEVALTVVRGGKEIEIPVRLGELK